MIFATQDSTLLLLSYYLQMVYVSDLKFSGVPHIVSYAFYITHLFIVASYVLLKLL